MVKKLIADIAPRPEQQRFARRVAENSCNLARPTFTESGWKRKTTTNLAVFGSLCLDSFRAGSM
jgi:hypothetical protein